VNRRLVRAPVIAGALLALSAAPALATHTHVMQVGNEECVVIAASGHEDEVVLPLPVWNNPNVDAGSSDTTRMHPLHVLVHTGVPGDHGALAVYGSDAGNALCSAGYVGD
jgi:hypothetical protein